MKKYNRSWTIIINFRDLQTEQRFLQLARKKKRFLSQEWKLTVNILDTKESQMSIQREDAQYVAE